LRLTVVIPNRNHSALLPRSLGAIANQHRQPDEIILVDDASTDNSVEVIRGFQTQLPQLRLLQNERRLGAVGALNVGVRAATGDAIYCGAADDETDPSLIETVLAALERAPSAGLACAEARVMDEDGRVLGIRPAVAPAIREKFFSAVETATLLRHIDNWVLSVVTIVRREAMLAAGGFDPSVGSFCDSFLARRIALMSGFVFVPHVLGTWHVQARSYSRSTSLDPEKLAELIAVCCERVRRDEGSVFPPGYSEVFARRARFSSGRLAITERDYDSVLINSLALGGQLDARCLSLFQRLPSRVRRTAALSWLTLRLHPISLVRLGHTMLWRRMRGAMGLTLDAAPSHTAA